MLAAAGNDTTIRKARRSELAVLPGGAVAEADDSGIGVRLVQDLVDHEETRRKLDPQRQGASAVDALIGDAQARVVLAKAGALAGLSRAPPVRELDAGLEREFED
jgi:hypothetical protein